MVLELYENKEEKYFIIKDGEFTLKLTADEFDNIRKKGVCPLLRKLWEQSRIERKKVKGQ